ncbi:MAG: DegT/DnrJ/EryC1/StrS family aminotransferase [Nostoc sp. EfeVER01]|uniref:DegT/DnrJ/EryC1/StrS family aminotransferase n=1 Tax=Nostoc sp. EfeVER01 TaxID=3075406 RepID=UPI002AD59381|nr:DegT/DnrJ/EryC1/StrS family aminotransferase [Nostoc sp. EfeVER01]MDZ7949328.1 DegT/DnrJ/EryC1/StrS family aminotransferase [Nostoc sp. EfeVER01]
MADPLPLQDKILMLPSDENTTGRTLGEAELAFLTEVIRSGSLATPYGSFVKKLEQQFADLLGVKYAYACSSGSAAVHSAIATVNPEPGDEIVTTPITDMGALTPILYQGAIPVFADVESRTWNVTAETIEPCLSERTKAIIVTHLFGNPCNMNEILDLAQSRGIPVIEDCAQAFLAKHNNQLVGTIGDIGCFSLQQTKHITTGEGGIVITNNDAFARRMCLFINKAWDYDDPRPEHYFLALNYRMSELQGAVGAAQLSKLPEVIQQRCAVATQLTKKLKGLPGIETPWTNPRNIHTYWRYCLRVDDQVIPGGPVGLGESLKEKGIVSLPRYIQKPTFQYEIFREQRTFGNSRFPFTIARPEALDYSPKRFVGAFEGLKNLLVLPLNEHYTDEHVEYIASCIHQAIQNNNFSS